MNKKLVGIVFAGSMLIAGGLYWGIPFFLDGTRQGRIIARALADETGLRIRIEGQVKVALLPRPRLSVWNVRMLGLDGQQTLAFIPQMDFNVGLFSLFSNSLSLSRLILNKPIITLSTDTSQAYLPVLKNAKTTLLAKGGIDIRAAQIVLQSGNTAEKIADLTGKIDFSDGSTLFKTNLSGTWRDQPLGVTFDIAQPIGSSPALANLQINLAAIDALLNATGSIETRDPRWPIEGHIQLKSAQLLSLIRLKQQFAGEPLSTLDDPALQDPFTLDARVEGTRNEWVLKNIDAALGELQASGMARIQLKPRLGISVAGQAPALNLAQWPTLSAALTNKTASIPAGWLGAYDVMIPALRLNDQLEFSNLHLKGDVSNSTLRFTEATATLAGETHASYTGLIQLKNESEPTFDGTLSLDTTTLRPFLAALGMNVPESIPQDTLNRLKLNATVRGVLSTVSVPDFNATIDGMDVRGQIGAPSPTSGRAVSMQWEQFDMAHFAQLGQVPAWIWPLPACTLDVTFKNLRMGHESAQNVSLKATLQPDTLTIDNLDTADFSGNRLRLNGTYSTDHTKPGEFNIAITTTDGQKLLQSLPVLQTMIPLSFEKLFDGPVEFSSRWHNDGKDEQQHLLSLSHDDESVNVVTIDDAHNPFHWKARIKSSSTLKALQRLLPLPAQISVLEKDPGPIDIYAEGKEDGNNLWTLTNIQGMIAGLTVRTGTLSAKQVSWPFAFDSQITLADGDLDALLAAIEPKKAMSLLQGSVDVTLEKAQLWQSPISDATMRLVFNGPSDVTLDHFSGQWMGGKVTAKGVFRPSDQDLLKGEISLDNIEFAQRWGDRFGVIAPLDATLRLETHGTDTITQRRNLEGDGEFSIDGGTVQGLSFRALTEALTAKPLIDIPLDPLLLQGGSTDLVNMGGNITLEEGVMTISPMRIKTTEASGEFNLHDDLNANRIDADGGLTLEKVKDAPPVNLILSGTTAQLMGHFDLSALEKWLSGKAPAAQTSSASSTQPTNESAEPASAPANKTEPSPLIAPPSKETSSQKNDDKIAGQPTTASAGAVSPNTVLKEEKGVTDEKLQTFDNNIYLPQLPNKQNTLNNKDIVINNRPLQAAPPTMQDMLSIVPKDLPAAEQTEKAPSNEKTQAKEAPGDAPPAATPDALVKQSDRQ